MSLNKLTDSSVKKEWMNINCNDLKATTTEVEGIDAKSINLTDWTSQPAIVADNSLSAAPVFITMRNSQLPVDQRTYGYYSSTATETFWFARFADAGGANINYLCFKGTDVQIPASVSLDLDNAGSLLNVPSSTTAGSFYEVLTSSGNVWSGAIPATGAEYTATRVGKNVTISFQNVNVTATASATIVGSALLPVSMRPPIAVNATMLIQDAGVFAVGAVAIGSSGAITVFSDADFSNFSGAGFTGFIGATLTYSV